MNHIIHTEPNGEHNVDTGDDVNCHVPEVQEAHQIDECGHHTGEHKEADGDVDEEKHSHNHHAAHGHAHVPHQFEPDDLVRFPGRVDLHVGEGLVGQPGFVDDAFDGSLGGYVLLRPLHREVVDGKHGRQDRRRRLAAAQLAVKLKVVLVAGALAGEEKVAEHLGEAVGLAERLPAAEVLLLQGVLLERRPPGVDGPQVGLVVHQSL